MTVKVALSTAQDAKKMAHSATELAHEAKASAQESLIKHDEHEKVCATRYKQIVDANKDITDRIQGFQNYAIVGMFGIIASLIGTIYYG